MIIFFLLFLLICNHSVPSHGKRDEWAVVAITISFIGLGSWFLPKEEKETACNNGNDEENYH